MDYNGNYLFHFEDYIILVFNNEKGGVFLYGEIVFKVYSDISLMHKENITKCLNYKRDQFWRLMAYNILLGIHLGLQLYLME